MVKRRRTERGTRKKAVTIKDQEMYAGRLPTTDLVMTNFDGHQNTIEHVHVAYQPRGDHQMAIQLQFSRNGPHRHCAEAKGPRYYVE